MPAPLRGRPESTTARGSRRRDGTTTRGIARAVTAPPAPISASETAAVAIGNSRRISAPRLPENQLERNPFCTSQVCATLATVWFWTSTIALSWSMTGVVSLAATGVIHAPIDGYF